MKMNAFLILLLAGLVVCDLLVRRHRTQMPAGTTATSRGVGPLAPVDAWQEGIHISPMGTYRADTEAARRLMDRLRREEERQRPQEGRN